MKFQPSLRKTAIACILFSTHAFANCESSYDRAVTSHYNKFSFSRAKNPAAVAADLKSKMYYNHGKGRTPLGAITMSTGRVIASSATGAALGYALPYVASGVMIGASVAGNAVLCFFGKFMLLCDAGPLQGSVARTTNATIGAASKLVTVAPITAIAGAGILGVRSVVLSAKDSVQAVKIRRLHDAKMMISAANRGDSIEFANYYEKLDAGTRSKLTVEQAMEIIRKADQSGLFCKVANEDPINFKGIKKAFKNGALNASMLDQVALNKEPLFEGRDADVTFIDSDKEVLALTEVTIDPDRTAIQNKSIVENNNAAVFEGQSDKPATSQSTGAVVNDTTPAVQAK